MSQSTSLAFPPGGNATRELAGALSGALQPRVISGAYPHELTLQPNYVSEIRPKPLAKISLASVEIPQTFRPLASAEGVRDAAFHVLTIARGEFVPSFAPEAA